MDAVTADLELAARRDSTRALLTRLWHEHVSHHKGRLLLILVLTAIMAGTTALYPVVIDHAFQMFTDRDRRILYQIPVLVVAITSIKAAAQYFQNVQVQQVVLLVIRELQGRMFAHLARADLAWLEREAPAQLAARFTTDATIIRDALTRAVNGMPLDQRPKVILFGAAPIPRTHTGKIQRRKLHPLFAGFAQSRGALRIERA